MEQRADLSEREQVAEERGIAVTPTPRLSASWTRSAGYGISLDTVQPAFTGSVDDTSLFYECGQEVLRGLAATLSGEPVGVMLTDANGLVLTRSCEEDRLVDALDDVYLAPGFSYSEREAGTNGLGLALADRAPTLVRADEHYCTGLWGYTCAAAPVLDSTTGGLLGSVNLTTWSQRNDALLLALAQLAAGNTAALMLARSRGRTPRPTPRGEVYRVLAGADGSPELSPAWQTALADAEAAMRGGRVVAVVGEAGTGRTTLLAGAHRRVRPQDRVLTARPPDPRDAENWLALWSPEVGKDHTGVIVGRIDELPSWVVSDLTELFGSARRRGSHGFAVTAASAADIPAGLRGVVDAVVELPALRARPDDVLPLARWFGRRARGREVRFTAAAERALTSYHWPGNAGQLRRVVRDAVALSDVVDARHLAAEVFSGPSHRLTRMETVERDEIVRCLHEPGTTVTQAARLLGMSRATIYRKIAQYGITVG